MKSSLELKCEWSAYAKNNAMFPMETNYENKFTVEFMNYQTLPKHNWKVWSIVMACKSHPKIFESKKSPMSLGERWHRCLSSDNDNNDESIPTHPSPVRDFHLIFAFSVCRLRTHL